MNSFVFTKHVSASSIPQQPQSVVWWAMGPLRGPPGLSRYLGSLGACSVAPPRRPRISQPGPRHHWVSPLALQHAAGSHPIESAGGGGGNGQLHENRKRGKWHFKEVHIETLLVRLGNTSSVTQCSLVSVSYVILVWILTSHVLHWYVWSIHSHYQCTVRPFMLRRAAGHQSRKANTTKMCVFCLTMCWAELHCWFSSFPFLFKICELTWWQLETHSLQLVNLLDWSPQ